MISQDEKQDSPREQNCSLRTAIFRLLLGAALISVMLLISQARVPPTRAAIANIVENGSFELPDLGNDPVDYIENGIPGWTIAEGEQIEIQNGVFGWQAKDGDQWVELDSFDSTKIQQTIATAPGEDYELNFAFAARPNTAKTNNQLVVEWDSEEVFSGALDGLSGNIPAGSALPVWHTFRLCVAANSGSTNLAFKDATMEGDTFGTFIDAVTVVEFGCNESLGAAVRPGAGLLLEVDGEPVAAQGVAEIASGSELEGACQGPVCTVRILLGTKPVDTIPADAEPYLVQYWGDLVVNAIVISALATSPESQPTGITAEQQSEALQLELYLLESGFRNSVRSENLTLIIGTPVATAESVGANDFSIEHDPETHETVITSFSGDISVTPADTAAAPFMIHTRQQVHITPDGAGDIVELTPVFLPMVRGG